MSFAIAKSLSAVSKNFRTFRYEQWTLFESFYYCFITLTTIGFGDYVAIQKNKALHTRPEYIVFSLLFILFGLAIFSAAVNLFVLRFMATNADSDANETAPHASILLRGISDDDLAATPNGSLGVDAHKVDKKSSSMDTKHGKAKSNEHKRPGQRRPVNKIEDAPDETISLNGDQNQSCCASYCLKRGRASNRCSVSSKWPKDDDDSLMPPQKLQRYTVRRSPVPIGHLVSVHRFAQAAAEENSNGPCYGMTVSTV